MQRLVLFIMTSVIICWKNGSEWWSHRVWCCRSILNLGVPLQKGNVREWGKWYFSVFLRLCTDISLLNPTALCLVPGRSLIKPIEWDFRTKKLTLSEQRRGLSNKATVGEKNWYLGTWSKNFPAENSPCLKAQGKLGYAAAESPCTSFLRCS